MARMGLFISAITTLVFTGFLYPSAVPSVVYLRADPDGVGTGWVVDAAKNLILTCRHVVGERRALEVFFPVFRDGRPLADAADYLGRRAEGTLVPGKLLRTSDALDLALIEVPSMPAGTRALPLAARRPALGQAVLGIGHRGDVDTLWNATAGTVRQRGTLADGYFWQAAKLAADLPALVLQSPIEEGDSGGPVLNGRGEVVGMIAALRRRTPLAAVGPDASAIRTFLKLQEPVAKAESGPVEGVARSTVWLRPTATDTRTAGVLIDRERRLVLTSVTGVGPLDRVGMTFPLSGPKGEIVAERERYLDGVDLLLAKRWAVGTVVVRDPRRDLALVRLDAVPDGVNAVSLAGSDPEVMGDAFALAHPMGLEFAFVAASGTLRQRGRIALGRDPEKPLVNLFQLPAQAASAGGPICNARGELIGIAAAKDAPQQQAYAASASELRAFLAEAPVAILAGNAREFWSGMNSLEKVADWYGVSTAKGSDAARFPKNEHGLFVRASQRSLASDWAGALADCDTLLLKRPQHSGALMLRANARLESKDVKGAIGDLQRRLDTDPGDLDFRTALAKCYSASGEPAKAAAELTKIARLKAASK